MLQESKYQYQDDGSHSGLIMLKDTISVIIFTWRTGSYGYSPKRAWSWIQSTNFPVHMARMDNGFSQVHSWTTTYTVLRVSQNPLSVGAVHMQTISGMVLSPQEISEPALASSKYVGKSYLFLNPIITFLIWKTHNVEKNDSTAFLLRL